MVREINPLSYDNSVDSYVERTKYASAEEIALRKKFMSLIPQRGKILDLACGPGRDAKFFSDAGFDVIGIDASPKMIERAKIAAPRASFHIMDMRHLPFYANNFDAVHFNAGLLCIEKKDAPAVLKKITEILVIGGLLFLGVKEGEGEEFVYDERDKTEKFYAYYTEEELLSLLKDYEIIEVGEAQKISHWIYVIARKV